jgi:hypothetical protein
MRRFLYTGDAAHFAACDFSETSQSRRARRVYASQPGAFEGE